MARFQQLFGLHAAQNIDDMRRTVHLARPVDRLQRLYAVFGAVRHVDGIDADVAIAAGFDRFAEIGEQRPAAAFRRFAVSDQRVEPLVFAAFAFRPGFLVLDKDPPHADVLKPVNHMGFRFAAVAPGAADFLRDRQ